MELKTLNTQIISGEDDDDNQSFDAPPELLYEKSKNQKLQNEKETMNLIKRYFNYLKTRLNSFELKQKILVIISLIISLICFLMKGYLVHVISKELIPNIQSLREIIANLLFNSSLSLPLYHINIFFLIIGLLIFSIQPFVEIYIRFRFALNPMQSRIRGLALNKVFFFVALGLIPETSIIMFNFKNRKNVILPFFIAKLYTQPFILIFFIIYGLVLLSRFHGKNRYERLKKHMMLYKKIVYVLTHLKMFRWNNFGREEEEQQGEDENGRSSDVTATNMSTMSEGNVLSMPFVEIKGRHIATIILFLMLISPILNGVFGYGYYVFFFKDFYGCLVFKLDIIFSVILSVLFIKIVS